MKKICVIIPVYNEEENLYLLYERLNKVFTKIVGITYTIIFIDDHSCDRTQEILSALAKKDTCIQWLRLSKNSGSHIACAAGLDHCNTDVAIIMAADLQDPPELIPQLLAKHQEGYQLVWAVRDGREGETWFTSITSKFFYWFMNRVTDLKMPPLGADVFLADYLVIEAFRKMPERHLSLFAALSWLGFRQGSISYIKQARNAGKSKWTLWRKVLLAIDSFVGFSYLPLRFMSCVGLISAGIGIVWGMIILLMRLMGMTQAVGYASIMITILILGGIQMLMLGVLGEYLWRTLEEARSRPRYFIESASCEKNKELCSKNEGLL